MIYEVPGNLTGRAAEASDSNTSSSRLQELLIDPTLHPFIAANPSASPSILEQLSRNQEVIVRRAVASNPNTPWPCLLTLALDFPHEFLRNPLLPLLELTQPPLMQQIDKVLWFQVLRSEHLPQHWLQWLLAKLQECGEAGPRWDDPIWGVEADPPLLKEEAGLIWEMAQLHVQIAGEVFPCRYEGALADLDPLYPGSSPFDIVMTFLFDPSPAARCAVSRALSPLLEFLVRFAPATLPFRHQKGHRGKLSTQMLRAVFNRLAQDPHGEVRIALATYSHTPTEVLEQLAYDSNGEVRVQVAAHTQIPTAMLCHLALDPNEEVRCAVASNLHTPVAALNQLAFDSQSEGFADH